MRDRAARTQITAAAKPSNVRERFIGARVPCFEESVETVKDIRAIAPGGLPEHAGLDSSSVT